MGSTPVGRAIYIFQMTDRNVAQLGRALGLGPRGRRFESCHSDHYNGALAQLGERLPCTQEVSGSIPLGSTIYFNNNHGYLAQLARAFGSYPKGRGFDSLGSHFNMSEVYPSLAEGIGLENRQAGNTARGFESLYLLHFN